MTSWPGDGFYGLAPTLAPTLAPNRGVAGFPGDPILSTQRIPKKGGGDLEENGDFLQVKRVVP